MPAEQFQLTLTHEGLAHSFTVDVLRKGLYFHYVVRPLQGPEIHVQPGVSENEHWHFTYRGKDKATEHYPASLLEQIGEALDRHNFTAML